MKNEKWNLSKLTYILLTLIGVLLIVLVILGTCTDTFKSVGIYKLPVLEAQKTSRLGNLMSLPSPPKGLTQLERGTVPRFKRSHELPKPKPPVSSSEVSSEEPSTGWMPSLKLFTPNNPKPKMKEPSLYSRLNKAANSGILKNSSSVN